MLRTSPQPFVPTAIHQRRIPHLPALSQPKIITGPDLRKHVAANQLEIKVYLAGETIPRGKYEPATILMLLKSREWYGKVARSGRVRSVHQTGSPLPVWQKCWRTAGAAVLSPPPGYMEKMQGI